MYQWGGVKLYQQPDRHPRYSPASQIALAAYPLRLNILAVTNRILLRPVHHLRQLHEADAGFGQGIIRLGGCQVQGIANYERNQKEILTPRRRSDEAVSVG